MRIIKQHYYHFHYTGFRVPSMGRQNGDSGVVHSSIALLQERFRQLERAKEMRRQQQLLKLFSEAEPARDYEPSAPFFHSELILPTNKPNSRNKQMDLQNIQTPNLGNLWPKDRVVQIRDNFDEPDVDTTLHL